MLLESPSSHQHGATRFKPKTRVAGSSSGGSASSTPHGLACTSSNSSTPQLQPHPPQSSRKSAKPPMGTVALGSSFGSSSAAGGFGLDCGSPVDSPRIAAAAAALAAAAASGGGSSGCGSSSGGGGGGDTPVGGSSSSSGGVYVRRARYSMTGIGNDGGLVVGSLGSAGGSGPLFGAPPGSSGRGVMGASSLMRSSSGIVSAAADGSAPTSPVPNLMLMRGPSSSGGPGSSSYLMSKLDGSSGGGGGAVIGSMGSGPLSDSTVAAAVVQAGMMGGSSSSISTSGGGGGSGGSGTRDSSSAGGVAPLLSARDSYSGGGGGVGMTNSPRTSFSGNIEGGVSGAPSPAAAAAAAVAAAAASRPGSGKKTVCLLVDAVRSRDDTQLASILACCSGGMHGPNDRHPITDRTPLHEAVWLGSTSMVKLLLEAGSNPNMGHPKEGSPLLQVRLCMCRLRVCAAGSSHAFLSHTAQHSLIWGKQVKTSYHLCANIHIPPDAHPFTVLCCVLCAAFCLSGVSCGSD